MNSTVTPILDHLAALSDPTRVRMLLQLERHELTVGELCTVLQLPQSTVSRHLKVLGDGGWVVARAEGPSRRYTLAPQLEPEARRLWQVVRSQLADGPAAALEIVDGLVADGRLGGYRLLPATRAELLVRLGRNAEARAEFEVAARLTGNARERKMLSERAAALPAEWPRTAVGGPAPRHGAWITPAARSRATSSALHPSSSVSRVAESSPAAGAVPVA